MNGQDDRDTKDVIFLVLLTTLIGFIVWKIGLIDQIISALP